MAGKGAGFSLPPSGVPYHRVLTGSEPAAARAVVGILSGLLVFFLFLPIVAAALNWLCWQLAGSPGTFSEYQAAAASFELPAGMVSTHLGIALLTLLSMGTVAVIHNVSPVWLGSVQPGIRWRYLIIVSVVAVVVLNGVLWVSRWDTPWDPHGRQDMWVFLVVIVLTSPFQALGEEVFFRGYLMQAFGSMVRTPWFAIITSAFVFASFHGVQNLPLFLDRFIFGVLAGYLVNATGGLEAAIAAHVVNNLFAFGYAAVESSVAQAKSLQEIGWLDALFDVGGFAVYALFAVVIGRRMKISTRTPELAGRPV